MLVVERGQGRSRCTYTFHAIYTHSYTHTHTHAHTRMCVGTPSRKLWRVDGKEMEREKKRDKMSECDKTSGCERERKQWSIFARCPLRACVVQVSLSRYHRCYHPSIALTPTPANDDAFNSSGRPSCFGGGRARAPHTHVYRTHVTFAATTHAQSLGERLREREWLRERDRYNRDTNKNIRVWKG
jgi:hypothetical protein